MGSINITFSFVLIIWTHFNLEEKYDFRPLYFIVGILFMCYDRPKLDYAQNIKLLHYIGRVCR